MLACLLFIFSIVIATYPYPGFAFNDSCSLFEESFLCNIHYIELEAALGHYPNCMDTTCLTDICLEFLFALGFQPPPLCCVCAACLVICICNINVTNALHVVSLLFVFSYDCANVTVSLHTQCNRYDTINTNRFYDCW